jgi:hypothetical protein
MEFDGILFKSVVLDSIDSDNFRWSSEISFLAWRLGFGKFNFDSDYCIKQGNSQLE